LPTHLRKEISHLLLNFFFVNKKKVHSP